MTEASKTNFYSDLANRDIMDDEIFVDFEVYIDQSILNWEYREFKNATFKKVFIIENAEIKLGFSFDNCKFEKGIMFSNIKTSNVQTGFTGSIVFKNCEIKLLSFERECNLTRKVIIEDQCKIENVFITDTTIKNGGLCIFGSSISYLHIMTSGFNLNFQNSNFENSFRIDSLKGDIFFLQNEFKRDIELLNIECPSTFSSSENIYNDKFSTSGSRIKKLMLFGDSFHRKGELENRVLSGDPKETYISELYISETNFTQGFDFNGLGKKLDRLEINCNPELKGVLKFQGWVIDNAFITGINQNLKLLFKSISFRWFVINDFTNYSDVSFDKCRGYEGSTLNLSDCDLGSTKFNEFDFNSFELLRFDNVSLDKIKPTNIKWFEDYLLKIQVSEQSEEERFKRKREIYRQLKQALKNSGNQIDSLLFQAREMECYRNQLKQSKNYSLNDKIIMTFSQFNDYGINWIKPVLIVFFSTFLLYTLILAGISDKILFSFSSDAYDIKTTFEVFSSNIKTFWYLFNPARRMDLTYGSDIESDWIYFIDLLHRIFLGIMIFQIIKAFRQHASS
ncbi:hypothetical protein ACQKCJ_08925 [Flavobacterium sp. NPDC079362]|uniref:hypothetical protein n=1 Tax=Flavobacterium sp. NPDC079362 TaxID=3390566 RepID=UPI003CFBD184